MTSAATLMIERVEAPVFKPVETVARLAYRFRYVGESNPHLSGQLCTVVGGGAKSTDPHSYAVVFACGCREVVPDWTLRRNSAGAR